MESKSPKEHAHVLFKAVATQGPGWALTRARIALLNKTGMLERRAPLQSWSGLSLYSLLKAGVPSEVDRYCCWRRQNAPRFFFEEFSQIETNRFVGEDSIRVADRILAGEFPFFGYAQNLGVTPQWLRNPLNHVLAPGGHWSKIDEFASGDIKLWWEPSRFSWVFALGRAYFRIRDDRYAEAFWQLLESWLEQNPPQWGIHWKCGQEAAFRAMALCFGFYAFAKSEASTPQRVARLVVAVGVHAKRIDAYTEYARSQKNNHGISEGTGLWTIGLLFPELQGADRWRTRGKHLIESEVRRQVYADGSYVQHSLNYHRVLLHDLAWALRLGERNDSRLEGDIYESFRKSVRFLRALTDSETGWAPNYGANDGALVLPLSDCPYPDMRPVLQSCHFIADNQRLYPPGPWDEEMVWMNGLASLDARSAPDSGPPVDLDARTGGYYAIHSAESWIMLRAANYKDRPSHADQLHLDLWWRGENVLLDCGTYSYNSKVPFENGFASTRYHNTVTVDGADQMTRLTRFLWADWANARVRRSEDPPTGLSWLEGEHDGYAKAGVIHRRTVGRANADTWIVVDDLSGGGEHKLRLHWQTPDVPFQMVQPGIANLKFGAGNVRILLASNTVNTIDLVRAGERMAGACNQAPDPARGWHSRYYGRKEPALSFVVESRPSLPVRFVTVVMLGKVHEVEIAPSFESLLLDSTPIGLSAIGTSPILVQSK